VLWSYGISTDLEEDKGEIITQALNYGIRDDLKLPYKLYPILDHHFLISDLKKIFLKKLYLDRNQK